MPMPDLGELDAQYHKEDIRVWKSSSFRELKGLLTEKGGHRAEMVLGLFPQYINPQSVVFFRPVLGNEGDMIDRGAENRG